MRSLDHMEVLENRARQAEATRDQAVRLLTQCAEALWTETRGDKVSVRIAVWLNTIGFRPQVTLAEAWEVVFSREGMDRSTWQDWEFLVSEDLMTWPGMPTDDGLGVEWCDTHWRPMLRSRRADIDRQAMAAFARLERDMSEEPVYEVPE